MVKLDLRLQTVASFVREGSRVADIGTDHGYLIAYLIENGISPCGIAADINKGPLENASRTIETCGLSDKVELILSDGLKNIPENSCDDIVIAGMGGNLIAEILSACGWIYDKKLHIIAQPMSHAEVLREYFIKNGFVINSEKTATDGKRLYCVISATFTGKSICKDASYIYLGELLKNNNSITHKYIEKTLSALEKKYNALLGAGKDDAENVKQIIDEIKMKITEAENDNC